MKTTCRPPKNSIKPRNDVLMTSNSFALPVKKSTKFCTGDGRGWAGMGGDGGRGWAGMGGGDGGGMGGDGGGWGGNGRLHPRVQPLTLLYTIFDTKG